MSAIPPGPTHSYKTFSKSTLFLSLPFFNAFSIFSLGILAAFALFKIACNLLLIEGSDPPAYIYIYIYISFYWFFFF